MPIQLQEFAKQVLFGTTIEEKLSFPREAIIDTKPGEAMRTPRTLTRPKHLMLREDGVRASHPSIAKLESEKERGRLLHFFGNHELLATELMALVLLKFPEAPASFRRGVLETLKEEQIHTRMYMHRMQQCGVEFGELPLSDYFWKSVSSMEDPLDYVTRLSLTFEQANLDYSREYAKIFYGVGDPDTAKILDKIYRDEIDHVGFGLKWFRKWKAYGKTDWEAYRERLVFPLSPARAKGNDFNQQGRQDAGLELGFINDLKIFQQSKGRTPSVYWFNPHAEQYAAPHSDQVIATNSELQTDLAYLPAYLSRKDDLLVMEEPPSPSFLQQLHSYGFHLPEIIQTRQNDKAPVIDRKLADIRPWAWSPDSVSFFKDTLPFVTKPTQNKQLWNSETRTLFSKTWCAQWAKQNGRATVPSCPDTALPSSNKGGPRPRLTAEYDADRPEAVPPSLNIDWLAPIKVYGKPAKDLETLKALRAHYQSLGYSNIVCKAPFGTAANGNRCIMESDTIDELTIKWLNVIWATQGEVLIEPWLNRIFDCSAQYERRDQQTNCIALTRMLNNPRGQFRGILTNGFCKGLSSELVRFLMERIEGRPRIYHYYENVLTPLLNATLSAIDYEGPIGVDAFVYRNNEDALRLKPIVEINPRYTMGRIGHELSHRNAPSSVGLFEILSKSQLKKSPYQSFSDYCAALIMEQPVRLNSDHKPRILTGSFPLTDPEAARHFLALYHVRAHVSELPHIS